MPSNPAETTSVARTSASGGEPVGDDAGARAWPPSPRTRGSSALRIATPPSAAAGRASSSSALASTIASTEPIRDRWTGWIAVTIPIDGRPIAARSRISPPVYMPISRTAAPCSGPRRSTVSGMPTSLFWLPSVRSVAVAAGQDARDRLLGGGLRDAPGDAHDERVEAAAPGRRHGVERTERVRDQHHGDVAQRVQGGSPAAGSGTRPTRNAGAPAPAAAARKRWPSVRSPGSATNSDPGATSRESTAPPSTARSLRRRRVPPVAATRSSAVRKAARGVGRAGGREGRRGASPWWRSGESGTVDRPGSVTSPSVAQAERHGAAVAAGAATGLVGHEVRRADRVVGDPAEQLERHHRHLEVAQADDGRRPLLDPHRHDQVRVAGLPPDVADERVVEEVDLPGALLRVPDLGRPGLAADLEPGDQGALPVEVDLGHDVLHQLLERRRTASAS